MPPWGRKRKRLRPLLRTLKRRPIILEACHGLRSPPQAAFNHQANDWLTDHVWCLAAEAYNRSRTACAVINTPITTVDSDTSGWQSDWEALENFIEAGISLGDWACTVAKHEAELKDPPQGSEWATYAVTDQQYWPPKDTMLIPPLPPDSPDGGLPFPFWNDDAEADSWWTHGQDCSLKTAARAMANMLRRRRDGNSTSGTSAVTLHL